MKENNLQILDKKIYVDIFNADKENIFLFFFFKYFFKIKGKCFILFSFVFKKVKVIGFIFQSFLFF